MNPENQNEIIHEESGKPAVYNNRWQTTMLLFAATGLIEALSFGHLSAFTPLYLRMLNVPGSQIEHWTGILASLGFILGLPLLPFWAVWADKYGRKIIIIRSSVAATLIYVLFAIAGNLSVLAFARFLGGFVLGNTGVMMAVQADITPPKQLGKAVALISSGAPVGMAIGPYMGGKIIQLFGIRPLFWLDATLTAAIVIVLMIVLKDEIKTQPKEQSTRQGLAHAFRSIAHTPSVVSLFAVAFFMSYGLSLSFTFIPILIERLYHGPITNLAPTIGFALTGGGIAMALTTSLWGSCGDKYGHLKILRICGLVVTLTVVGFAISTQVWQVTASRIVQGICQGGLSSLIMVLLALYSPIEKRSSVLTLSLLPQQLSWFLGPFTGTFLTAISLRTPFIVGSVGMAIGLILTYRLPRTAIQSN